MNAERFERLLDAYGAEARRWPAAEREAAAAFAATAEGQAAMAEARELEMLLDAAPALQPSHDLRSRVLAAAPRERSGWAGGLRGRLGFWASGAGLAAAGLAGVLFGATLSRPEVGAESGAELLLAEAGAFDETILTLERAP
jgi:hypothetical protein